MAEFEYQFKLVLIGHDKSGKSNLISRFVSNSFTSSYVATIGTDFKVRKLSVTGKTCQLQIWDTAGLSCFQSAADTIYRNAQGIFICFDVTNRNSFESIPKWLHQAQSHSPIDAIIYVIGCKCECSISARKVTREEAELLATSKGCRYGEVSSKSNLNVDQIFQEMSILLCDQADKEAENATLQRRSTLTEGNRLLQSAYAVHISGATSWYNANKINGRYVPQMSKTSNRAQAEEFSYTNIDSPSTVMVYRNNQWVVRVHNKPLARVASNSILCFPDTASAKNVWSENTGVYFTWWHARPTIKCALLNTGQAGGKGNNNNKNNKNDTNNGIRKSVSNPSFPTAGLLGNGSSHGSSGSGGALASVAAGVLAVGAPPGFDLFAGARAATGGTGMNMDLFTQCSKEPSRLGLSSPLFVQYCAIRLAVMEYERRHLAPGGGDSRVMLHICAQLQRVQDTVREMAAALKVDLQPPSSPIPAAATVSSPAVAVVTPYAAANAGAETVVVASSGVGGSPSSAATAAALSVTPVTLTTPVPAPAPAPASLLAPVPVPLSAAALNGPLIEASVEAITAAIKEFTRPLSRHLVLLCDVENGNFEQARRCRDVRVEVEQYVLDLQQPPPSRTSFSFSARTSFSARNSFSCNNNGTSSNRGSFSRASFSGRTSFSAPAPPPQNVVAK